MSKPLKWMQSNKKYKIANINVTVNITYKFPLSTNVGSWSQYHGQVIFLCCFQECHNVLLLLKVKIPLLWFMNVPGHIPKHFKTNL